MLLDRQTKQKLLAFGGAPQTPWPTAVPRDLAGGTALLRPIPYIPPVPLELK